MELSKKDTAGAETNKKASTKVTLGDRIKAILNFFTVEPFLLCYILPSVISAVAVQKLNMEKACRVDLGYTEAICADAIAGNAEDNITIAALNDAQVLVAEMYAWKQPLQSGIPAAAILFVGAWSDRTGNRKSLMMIPILGELISALGLMLSIYFFLEWPLWVTGVVEALPPACMGGLSIALMGSYSYIADVTSVDSRTFRIGVVAVIVTLGIPIGTAISGVLTDAVGYYGIFGIGIALYIIGFIHTYFRIHDVKSVESTGTWTERLIEFFHPKNAWDTLSLLFRAKGKKCLQIILVISAHLLIMGPVYGEGSLLFLYFLKKFSMDVVEFSLFSTYSVMMGLLGTIIAVTVFSKWLKMHDSLLGIIATVCKVASSFVYALAPTRSWLYVAPAVDFFGNSGTTAIRSLGTKVVEPDEVGKMCSIVGLADAIIPVVAVPIYTKVYSTSLEDFSGAFYLLGAAMTAPAFFVFIALYVLYKKQQRDIVRNPEIKAQYAHDNDVTAL